MQAAAIARKLPSSIEKIGVFVDAPLDQIYLVARECGLTGVQLHFNAAPDLPEKIRKHLGPQIRILQVVHFSANNADVAAQQIERHASNPHVDAVLVDSRAATAVGGTGSAFDWASARSTIFLDAKERKLIAAGGLNPANVARAIVTLRPWGVDAVSGVESTPGKKDPAKVRKFVANARAASRE
jgi:phosphoribosylanthranilate isomerase